MEVVFLLQLLVQEVLVVEVLEGPALLEALLAQVTPVERTQAVVAVALAVETVQVQILMLMVVLAVQAM